MENRYAVLEWEEDVVEVANVVMRDATKEQAEIMVRIAPDHLHREIITMAEYSELKANQ